MKGTNTDASTDYPELSLVNGNNAGSVALRINYASYKYRASKEGMEPEFEIIAQGHEAKAWNSDPAPIKAKIADTARIAIKVKFIQNCKTTAPASAQ